MWTPKSREFEDLANTIAYEYKEPPEGKGTSVPEIARIYKLSLPSVYRYLRYKGVKIRPKRRNDEGKFMPSR
jgi:Mor family transcriptional regulator